jgi:hypothetical protein
MQKKPLIARLGTFFILVGIGVFIVFISSDLAQQPDFDYLFIAILLIGVGWLFQRKRSSPPSSGRFSMLRGMLAGRRTEENKDEQEKK